MKPEPLCRCVAAFAPCFDLFQGINAARCGLANLANLQSRPLAALVFFTFYCHERQGRDPKFAALHRAALYSALRTDRYRESLNREFVQAVCKGGFATRVWSAFGKLAKNTNERQTAGPVRDVLLRLAQASKSNLVDLLLNLGPGGARVWLLELKGIGPKIASLVVRDCFSFCDKPIPEADSWLAQPIDRWVRRWASVCWKKARWSGKQGHDDGDARLIAELCRDSGTDPIAFNKGAWFVGANFTQLRLLHQLLEKAEADQPTAIRSLDPNRTMRAMEAYSGASNNEEMLVLY